MRRRWLIGIALPLLFGCSASMAQSIAPRTVAKFPGACLKWIHVAEVETHRKNLNVDNYIVSVVEEDEFVTVILKSADAPEGSKGSGGSHVGYEVEIRKRDSKVMRSYYLR
jgi:hypothetical protein